jgi:Tfp pilus assembly PilM family ATPase
VLNKLAEALDIDYSMAEELIRKNGLINDRKSNSGTLSLDINDVSVVIHEICKPQFLKLVESINRLLVFSASETRGVPVSRVYLLGAVGRWKGSDLLLRSMLNIEVAPIREEDDFYACFPIVKGKSVNGIVPEMVKATGYALRGLVGDA